MASDLRSLYWPGPFRALYQQLQGANAASAQRLHELLAAREDWLLSGLPKFQGPSGASRAAARDAFKAGKLVLGGGGDKGGQRVTLDARLEEAALAMSGVLVSTRLHAALLLLTDIVVLRSCSGRRCAAGGGRRAAALPRNAPDGGAHRTPSPPSIIITSLPLMQPATTTRHLHTPPPTRIWTRCRPSCCCAASLPTRARSSRRRAASRCPWMPCASSRCECDVCTFCRPLGRAGAGWAPATSKRHRRTRCSLRTAKPASRLHPVSQWR